MEIAAGIDFGGSSAKIGLVERSGRILGKVALCLDPKESFEGIVAPVAAGLKGLLTEHAPNGTLIAIGIGTPGFIDKTEGKLIGGCENIPSLQNRSVQAYMARQFGVPAYAENDATSAAAGELAFGAGRDFKSFVLITVGTAIGGGIVLDGKVYRGWRGFAGEVGHLCMVPEGLWCNCGSRGCFEQYASGTAIARIYTEKMAKRGGVPPADLTPKAVFQKADQGDPCALDTVDEAARWIARAFGSILNILDLEACIVGGGVSEAGETLLAPIRRHLPDHCWQQIGRGVRVLAAALRNDAGILGAAAQALERLEA